MRMFWELVAAGFRRFSTYRAATLAGAFTNTVWAFLLVSVMVAVFRERPHIGNFDVADAITFTFLAQALVAAMAPWGWFEIAHRVRTGDVATDLWRPFDFQLWWLGQDLGRAAYQLVARGLPPTAVGVLAYGLRVSARPVDWAAFAVALTVGVVLSFALRFLANLASFWLLDASGPVQILSLVWTTLSGFILPLTLFPPWLEALARALPFAGIVQVPIEVLLGKHSGLVLVRTLVVQALWAVALLGVGRAVLAAARRRVVVQGG